MLAAGLALLAAEVAAVGFVAALGTVVAVVFGGTVAAVAFG